MLVWIGMNKATRITLSSPTLTYSEPNGDRAFSCHLAKIELRVFRWRTSPPGNELPVLAGMNVFSEFRRLPVTAVLLLLLPSAGRLAATSAVRGPVQGTGDSANPLERFIIVFRQHSSLRVFFLFFFFLLSFILKLTLFFAFSKNVPGLDSWFSTCLLSGNKWKRNDFEVR